MPKYHTTQIGELYLNVCEVCGSVVIDREQHTKWHGELQGVARQARFAVIEPTHHQV